MVIYYLRGIVNWSGAARFVVLGLIDGPGQLFQYFFFLYFHLKQETVFYGFHSENIFLEKNT